MRKHRQKGFSLVEVLVAIALVAVAMLAIAPLFTGGLRSNAVGWDFSALNALAKARLEEVLQYSFSDARLRVPAGSTVTLGGSSVTGKLYVDQNADARTVAGVTTTFPYELIYVVQNYKAGDIVNADLLNPAEPTLPDPTKAVDDGAPLSDWDPALDVKYITVIAASGRRALQGTSYNLAPGLAATSKGKQIRMSAVKGP